MKKLASVYNCKIQLIFYIVLRLVIYCIVIIIMTRMMINKRYSFAAAYISFLLKSVQLQNVPYEKNVLMPTKYPVTNSPQHKTFFYT